jgi:hypothetical protein
MPFWLRGVEAGNMPPTLRETLVTQPLPDDGTAQLLRAGVWILLVGGVAAIVTATVLGGIGQHGPHTNSGWLTLLLAMMCLPFGTMLTLLGAAKWLRNRRIARK